MHMIYKGICLKQDDFQKFAVCPKCKALYPLEDCIKKTAHGKTVSLKCSYIRYPRHTHKTRRQPCGTALMKLKRSKSTSNYLYPKQMYCFKKVSQSLQELIYISGFTNKCELWRNRNLPEETFGDIFEGRVWKDFQSVNNEPFLSAPNNFGLMLINKMKSRHRKTVTNHRKSLLMSLSLLLYSRSALMWCMSRRCFLR